MTCISKAIYRGNCSLPRDNTWIRGLGEKIVSDIHKFDYRNFVDNTRFVFAGSSYMYVLHVHHRSDPRELYIVYIVHIYIYYMYLCTTCIVSTSASDQHSTHFIESPDIRIETSLGDFPINNEQVDLYKLHICETAIRIVAFFETALCKIRRIWHIREICICKNCLKM